MSTGKKKLKALLIVLSKCENNVTILGHDQVQNIINDIRSSNKFKFADICRKPYFKTILDIVFSYYEINRDEDTEQVYNNLLQLIETSISNDE